MSHTRRVASVVLIGLLSASLLRAEPLPIVDEVDVQPLKLQVQRLYEAMQQLGMAISPDTRKALDAAANEPDADKARRAVQDALDPYCLIGVHINPESRVKVALGQAQPVLDQQGWRQFLVKVHNEAGVTAELKASSPSAAALFNSPPNQVDDRWLDMSMFNGRPLNPKLSGLELEYRIIQLYSRDAGKRSAVLAFDVGQGTQDIGFRNDVTITFNCLKTEPTTLRVLDENGKPTTACFEIRDAQGRVYPSQAKRLAPDFAFHPQVYRADGETVTLPAGTYTADVTRGPEYYAQRIKFTVGEKREPVMVKLKRWVDPAALGWWSGDHHIHAAGCAHYTNPSEGVHAPDMLRHCIGEDLKIGANLTWGPCFDYQKQFFTGAVDKVSTYPYLLRYDVEVSGFGSHQSGHLCLLRLKEQMYPGGDSKHHWPTLCLNTLKWAKKQGAVVGPAHSGWGLAVPGTDLPNYTVPPMDGIGAIEYIVDVTHEVPGPDGKLVPAVDFMSLADTPYYWEVNMWYHTLNVGYRTRVSGETDFPCIYGERVGLGRSYVKLDGKLDYDDWCQGIREGRNYVGDGRSHLMEFAINDHPLGVKGSEVKLEGPTTVKVTVKAAALLDEKPIDHIRRNDYTHKPYWHIERARVGDGRNVPVEVVVNGQVVAKREITADGSTSDLTFEVPIERSSWVAIRVPLSCHTNPIWVMVGDKPVRASKRSAEWCLKAVEQCWSQKKRFIHEKEMDDAVAAYDHARAAYKRIIEESDVE